jgi:transposase
LATPVEGLRQYVRDAGSAHIDETSWWQGPDKAWLWGAVTSLVTVFTIATSRFEWWHRVRDGTLARSGSQTYVATMRPSLKEDLERGSSCACSKTAGTCRELLSGETHLWTFVRVCGIEPTNNDAERALRHGVIHRKLGGGTDSESGSRFVERILSVVATCRQQDIHVLDDLTRCYQTHPDGQPAPSLLPASSTTQAA